MTEPKATNEVEVAAQAAAKIRQNLETICKVMDDLHQQGLIVQWGIGKDNFGRNIVTAVNVAKVLV